MPLHECHIKQIRIEKERKQTFPKSLNTVLPVDNNTGELLHYSCVLNELATGHITETKT